jgi:hypothetical protein
MVQLVHAGGVTRLSSTATAQTPVVAEDAVPLAAFREPLVLDRSLQIRFTSGLAAALPTLLVGGFLLDYPLLAAICFALALALFVKLSLSMRYVVELSADADFRLVLSMGRAEWLALVLAARGYAPAR